MLKPLEKKHEQAIIKRGGRKHEEDEHGGAWKVAFADFCLALLSLFLVLWLMAAREQQAMKAIMSQTHGSKHDEGQGVKPEGGPRGSLIDRIPLSGSAKQTGSDPSEAARPKVSYESPDDLAALSRVLAKMSAEAGLTNNLQTVVTPYGLRVMLHDTDHLGMFVRGSSILTNRFKKLLRTMGRLFGQMENQMLIIGHTDSLQYADTGYAAFSNWTLSSNRAMAARANLLEGDMKVDSVLQVVGMADRAPLDAKNAAAGVNRRIELLILTRAQANNVAAMFGVAGKTQALTDDIDTAMPNVNLLKSSGAKSAPAAVDDTQEIKPSRPRRVRTAVDEVQEITPARARPVRIAVDDVREPARTKPAPAVGDNAQESN